MTPIRTSPSAWIAHFLGSLTPLASRSWYAGKTCTSCGRKLDTIADLFDPPGVRDAGGLIREWCDVPPRDRERLRDVGRPVCRGCLLENAFARVHPGGPDS